jgi:hypothetical protein
MRLLHRTSRRTRFPSHGDTTLGSLFRSWPPRTEGPGLELFTRYLHPVSGVDTAGLSRSWGILMCSCYALRPRQDPRARPSRLADSAPALKPRRRLPALWISRLDRTASALAVYASQSGVTPDPRKTRFRLPASSTGRDWLPAGLHRKVSDMLPYIFIPPSQVLRDARLAPRSFGLAANERVYRTPNPVGLSHGSLG